MKLIQEAELNINVCIV